jgi:segregation and condensation protein A
LPIFRGPLDLLLYLVRKHEVEIVDIPIAPITEQFIDYLALLQQLDLAAVGEFVDMASTLLEIKSRLVLPHGDEEDAALADPRQELVHRLLEYKRFKDAASMLEERGRAWQDHFARAADDLPPRVRDLAAEEIREVELWDLVSAFGRVVRDSQAVQPSNIVYDETPIHVYMAEIQARLLRQGQLRFHELFRADMHRSALVGIFLAVLELVRHERVRTEQNDLFGEIWILPGQAAEAPLDAAAVDNYDHGPAERSAPQAEAADPAADE